MTIANFNSLFRVCLIFYTYDSADFKASRITPWKKSFSFLADITDTGCINGQFAVQNKPTTVKRNHPCHSSFLELGGKAAVLLRLLMTQKVNKTETANIRKWIARFYYFRHLYSAGSACVLLTIIAWVAHRYGQLYLHCSLIYFWVPSSCFCIVISLSLRSEIIPFSGVCQSGRLHYPRRRRWLLHALTDRLLWCATDDDQRQHHHAEHHFQL